MTERLNKIKERRLGLGWTQQKLADFIGCSIRIVQSWEAGRRYPPEWTEKLILDKLETPDPKFSDGTVIILGGAEYEINACETGDLCCAVYRHGQEQKDYIFSSYTALLEFILADTLKK